MELAYQDEQDIIDVARKVADADVCFYPAESDLAHRCLASLRGTDLTQRERPDFEDVTRSLLLEAMRVDDHPRPGKKDATRARESQILRELEDAGFGAMFPNATLVTNVSSGLPTEQDHSYRAYVAHFASVVSKHGDKAPGYRGERPGFDLGFLVFDESTAYFESMGSFAPPTAGRVHRWFADAAFLNVITAADVDCVVWLTPYKQMKAEGVGRIHLPRMTIIDVGLLRAADVDTYDAARMMSTEL